MKIALLGDVHIGVRNDNPLFHIHFAKFYNEVFFPYLEKENILHVIQLGDVFDRRKYINFNSLKQAHEYLFDRLNNEYLTWMLVGNHDTYFKNTNEVNSLDLLLAGYHNITAVNRPTDIEFEEVNFLLLPWMCDDNKQECIDAIAHTNANVIVGHFEIDGFEMYKGVEHQGGMSHKTFDPHEMVLSGHFHHRSTSRNIHYLGTPYEMTWSDYNDQKGFHIYNTEDRSLTFVPNPNVLFHKLHYDDADKQISEVVNIDFSVYNQTFVKLIVRNKTNPYCFDMFIDKLEKAGCHNVQVVDDHFHMDVATDDEIISEAEDTITILSKYINQLDDTVEKQSLDLLLKELYEEALSVE